MFRDAHSQSQWRTPDDSHPKPQPRHRKHGKEVFDPLKKAPDGCDQRRRPSGEFCPAPSVFDCNSYVESIVETTLAIKTGGVARHPPSSRSCGTTVGRGGEEDRRL